MLKAFEPSRTQPLAMPCSGDFPVLVRVRGTVPSGRYTVNISNLELDEHEIHLAFAFAAFKRNKVLVNSYLDRRWADDRVFSNPFADGSSFDLQIILRPCADRSSFDADIHAGGLHVLDYRVSRSLCGKHALFVENFPGAQVEVSRYEPPPPPPLPKSVHHTVDDTTPVHEDYFSVVGVELNDQRLSMGPSSSVHATSMNEQSSLQDSFAPEEEVNLDTASEQDSQSTPTFQEMQDEEENVPELRAGGVTLEQAASRLEASFVPNVVVVGAGPVGLWSAIQIKIRCPNLEILVLEKYAVYTRRHLLRLNHRSLRGIPTYAPLKALCKSWPAAIRTSEMEDGLLRLACELGIQFRIQKVESTAHLKEMYPSANILIGADGSHSTIRKDVFGDVVAVREELQHIVDLKYEIYGPSTTLDGIDSWRILKRTRFIVQEHVGKEKEGRSAVTVRVIIDKHAYDSVSTASFKEPVRMWKDGARIDARIYHALSLWLNARRLLLGEQRVEGSEALTPICLSAYASQSFSALKDIAVFLVGDAAFGVPYFRSLNNGLLCGTRLALAIRDLVTAKTFEATVPVLKSYSASIRSLAELEIARARLKQAGISAADIGMSIKGLMPSLIPVPQVWDRITEEWPELCIPQSLLGDEEATERLQITHDCHSEQIKHAVDSARPAVIKAAFKHGNIGQAFREIGAGTQDVAKAGAKVMERGFQGMGALASSLFHKK